MKLKQLVLSVVLGAAMLVSVGCVDSDNATRVLQQNGYTNVQITGYEPWMCSNDDTYSTGFKATSPNGRSVEGAVCSAWAKGYTIRFK